MRKSPARGIRRASRSSPRRLEIGRYDCANRRTFTNRASRGYRYHLGDEVRRTYVLVARSRALLLFSRGVSVVTEDRRPRLNTRSSDKIARLSEIARGRRAVGHSRRRRQE